MLIKVLMDNIAEEGFESEHGLSYYIETGGTDKAEPQKVLFDAGETDKFALNALKSGVDLSKVDLMFVSHAHDDHCGGLETFAEMNPDARIYLNENIFTPTYAYLGDETVDINSADVENIEYIGIDLGLRTGLTGDPRVIFTGKHEVINDRIETFSSPAGRRYMPASNSKLHKKSVYDSGDRDRREKDINRFTVDDFEHEQNLLFLDPVPDSKEDRLVLVTGCAHRGIINIIEEVRSLKGRYPDIVIGGFHLGETGSKSRDSAERIEEIAHILESYPCRYYTGHCTGSNGYEMLSSILGDRIAYLKAGIELFL